MALIRYVSLGALRFRSGRYATRSRTKAVAPPAAAPATIPTIMNQIAQNPVGLEEPITARMANRPPYPPAITTSEWAKLMSLRTP